MTDGVIATVASGHIGHNTAGHIIHKGLVGVPFPCNTDTLDLPSTYTLTWTGSTDVKGGGYPYCQSYYGEGSLGIRKSPGTSCIWYADHHNFAVPPYVTTFWYLTATSAPPPAPLSPYWKVWLISYPLITHIEARRSYGPTPIGVYTTYSTDSNPYCVNNTLGGIEISE